MAKQSGAEKDRSGSGGATTYEQELTELLKERIKPGLNSGSIPLLARSIAKDIAARQRPDEAEPEEDDESRDEAVEDEPGTSDEEDDQPEPDDGPEAEAGDEGDEDEDEDDEAPAEDEEEEPAEEISAFEDEMHQLQEDLGDDWVVRFSVQNDEAWLTAEKADGSQHVEAPTADVLRQAVELLESGGESD
jgi:hypothetical protein